MGLPQATIILNMTDKAKYKLITYFIATVWIVNGLFCKVLNLVPRHQEIVASILNEEYARLLTLMIGISEMGMAIWILSGRRKRLNAIVQILVIAIMNVMEFAIVPDQLLWGKGNVIFAFIFILLIYFNEFSLNTKLVRQT